MNLAQFFRLRVAFHTLPLFHLRMSNLRAFARKNYATVEINLNSKENYSVQEATRKVRYQIRKAYGLVP